MKIFFRIALITGFIALIVFLLIKVQHPLPVRNESGVPSSPPHFEIVVYYVGILFSLAAIGLVVGLSFAPWIGEKAGAYFYLPKMDLPKSAYDPALASVAAGDYQQAAAEYLKVLEQTPDDSLAISELSRIYCERLDNSAAASGLLESALKREWTLDEAMFLRARLADVYWTYQKDSRLAIQTLEPLTTLMPGSRYANQAVQKIREIEFAEEEKRIKNEIEELLKERDQSGEENPNGSTQPPPPAPE